MNTFRQQLHGVDSLIASTLGDLSVSLTAIDGEVEVLQIIIEHREEQPIYITYSDTQILCICYLWCDNEIISAKRQQFLETLLKLNPAMPLSSFGMIGDRHILFGAIARHAPMEAVAHDVVTLSDNAWDALDSLSEFIKETP